MVFTSPSWVPQLPFSPPDSVSICDFMLEEHHGRHPLGYSNNPFTCGLTGKTYTSLEVRERVDYLARGLAKELGFHPNKGSEWDKVVAVFSVNTLRMDKSKSAPADRVAIVKLHQGAEQILKQTLLYRLLNPLRHLLRRLAVRNVSAVHPLVHLAVLTPIIRVAADLEHVLAGDIF